MDNPKTRQEKKCRGKFYGKIGSEVYTQKHVRAHENIVDGKGKTKSNPSTASPPADSKKPQTNKRKKR